jgi:hypothetical protein
MSPVARRPSTTQAAERTRVASSPAGGPKSLAKARQKGERRQRRPSGGWRLFSPSFILGSGARSRRGKRAEPSPAGKAATPGSSSSAGMHTPGAGISTPGLRRPELDSSGWSSRKQAADSDSAFIRGKFVASAQPPSTNPWDEEEPAEPSRHESQGSTSHRGNSAHRRDDDDSNAGAEREEGTPPPSEETINEMAADLLRAELMGDEVGLLCSCVLVLLPSLLLWRCRCAQTCGTRCGACRRRQRCSRPNWNAPVRSRGLLHRAAKGTRSGRLPTAKDPAAAGAETMGKGKRRKPSSCNVPKRAW